MLTKFKVFCETYRMYLIGSLLFFVVLTGLLVAILILDPGFTFIYNE